jgi:hypothetical protein
MTPSSLSQENLLNLLAGPTAAGSHVPDEKPLPTALAASTAEKKTRWPVEAGGFCGCWIRMNYRASAQSPPIAQIQAVWIRVIPIAMVVGAGMLR